MVTIPKRNKSKDKLGFDDEKNVYTVEFVDNKNIFHKVEINEQLYNAFDKFELEDISQIHKYRSHIEHSEVYEETLNKRILHKPISVEEQVEMFIVNERVKNAVSLLPEIQKRRIKKYFFGVTCRISRNCVLCTFTSIF